MQSYALYTDRNENFECEVSSKNASLKGAAARLVVESSEGVNFVFEGKISGQKCVIPIRKFKGLLEENSRGKMYLEVIVEDTVFRPWKSEYVVESHTTVHTINESITPTKPEATVKVNREVALWVPLKEIAVLCETFGINKESIANRRQDLMTLLKEYFKANPEFANHKVAIISGIKSFLT